MDRCCSSGRASQRRMVRQGLSTFQSVVVRERNLEGRKDE